MSDKEIDASNSNICEVIQILGSKWTVLVLDGLQNGPQRFNQLQRNTSVIRTQSLRDALRHLENYGLVSREVFPTVPVSVEYALTDKGADFRAALQGMEKWVEKWGGVQQNGVAE